MKIAKKFYYCSRKGCKNKFWTEDEHTTYSQNKFGNINIEIRENGIGIFSEGFSVCLPCRVELRKIVKKWLGSVESLPYYENLLKK